MKTKDFRPKLTSRQIKENMEKQFGVSVKLENYSREQLEDLRNKLRTRMFQQENKAGINDLLTNETYQKDKAMLALLNTRIKEMLGEDIKKIRDKIDALSEAKKGTKPPKTKIKGKGTNDGNLANNYPPYDKVTRGDVIAGATGKDQKGGATKEGANPKGTYGSEEHPSKDREGDALSITSTEPGKYGDAHSREERAKHKAGKSEIKGRVIKGKAQSGSKEVDEAKEAECNHTAKGEKCPVHGMKECPTMAEGKDEGKPGKGFAKIVKAATPKYGKERAMKIAGAQREKMRKAGKLEEANEIYKRHVSIVNESLIALLQENEEEKAKAITAAGDIVNDYTSWMQRVGQYQTKSMIELADSIRADFGPNEAEAFKQAVGPALDATLEVLMQQREAISNAVAVLAGEAAPTAPTMGAEPAGEPAADMGPPEAEPAAPDEMNTADMTAAAEPAATGREVRESRVLQKIQESHSIISKLAK